MNDRIMRIRGLRKIFGKGNEAQTVIPQMDLDLFKGQQTVIMGPSGSGKSTLLYLLSTLEKPDGGSIIYGKKDIAGLGEKETAVLRRRNFGFIFQFYNLLPVLNVEDNVYYTLDLLNERRRRHKEWVDHLLEEVGLTDKRRRYPHELSGGQQQRVAIVRALSTVPEILFSDEPAGNLDSENSERVKELLFRMGREEGITTITVTHDETFRSLADRVLVLKDGLIEKDELVPDKLSLQA